MERAKAAFEGALFLKGWTYEVEQQWQETLITCTGSLARGAWKLPIMIRIRRPGVYLWNEDPIPVPPEMQADVILALDMVNDNTAQPRYRMDSVTGLVRLECSFPWVFGETMTIQQADWALDGMMEMDLVFRPLVEEILKGKKHRFDVRAFLEELATGARR